MMIWEGEWRNMRTAGNLDGRVGELGESRGSKAGGMEKEEFKQCNQEVERLEFGTAPESNTREGGGVDAGCFQFGQLRDARDQKQLSEPVDIMGPQTVGCHPALLAFSPS